MAGINLAIYFPKQVAIDNPRLWVVQNCFMCWTFIIVILLLVQTKVIYVREKIPSSTIQTWVETPALQPKHQYWGDTEMNQANTAMQGSKLDLELLQGRLPGIFTYEPQNSDWKMINPEFSPPCDALANFGTDPIQSCMSAGDAYKVTESTTIKDRTVGESIFIPTAYVEEFFTPGKIGTSCPYTSDETGRCIQTKYYIVPGVEHYKVKFEHGYEVKAPTSYMHKFLGLSREVKSRLRVTVRGQEKDSRVEDFDQDSTAVITVANLFKAAGLPFDALNSDNSGPAFPANTNGAYRTTRVTGMEMITELDYKGLLFETGPVCDVTVATKPNFVGMTDTMVVNEHGTSRTRTYSGIRIKFVRKGSFEWFQAQALVMSATTLLVWIRIPFMMVFYFAVYCLGALSAVYSRFLYQDLNLHNEFNGVSSRLLKRSHGFNDLHDLVTADGTRAISYAQSKKRMQRILEGRRELDEEEREYFTAYFFNSTATKIGGHANSLAISMQNYLKSVSSEESLQYDDIMMFIDADSAKLSIIEKLFIDGSLKKFVESKENMKKRQSRAASGMMEEEGERVPLANAEGGEVNENFAPKSSEDAVASQTTGGRSSTQRESTTRGSLSSNRESGSARVTKMAKKQSMMFQLRMVGNTLTSKLDHLQHMLDDLLRHKEMLQDRNNDYLHYLAHLNEQIRDVQKK